MVPLTAEKKDPFIHVPAHLILTRDGLNLFGSVPGQVKKVRNRDGIMKEGLESPSFNATVVQKMIMNSCIEEIYISLPDLLRKRFQIISTNNLVMYAILYKKLSPSLARMLFDSPVVKDFNRKNPKYSIVDLKQINAQKIELMRQTKKELFETIEAEITSDVIERIAANPSLSDEDKNIRTKSLPKFIAWIDRRIWYLYLVIYQTPMKIQMRSSFANMIAMYLDHTKIATHLSNLLMEFIQNAEKAHLERVIVKANMGARDAVDKLLRDPKQRLEAIDAAEKQNQMLDVSWNMNTERNNYGHSYRIQITISNFGLIDENIRSFLYKKMKSDVDGISLADFYQDQGDTEKLGAGLGLLYNSYLLDICKKEGISYRCNIFPEPEKEKTTVKIDITL